RGAAPAWNNLGIARDEQGDAAGAEDAYRRALALDPGYWQARLNLGIALARAGRAGEAREALDAVVAAVPAQPDAHRELGALYAGPLADRAKARLHWNAFLRHASGHSEAAAVRRRLAELPP
ncbi:MAG TPA: tetratricopeptide repeat protein, partial [Thermoanaerobaculia bacterium]|nr:tetratricopeptide repeat protein [Thermoanaerobaculia bacterium]